LIESEICPGGKSWIEAREIKSTYFLITTLVDHGAEIGIVGRRSITYCNNRDVSVLIASALC